ncbi:MAG: hypothetical protein EZS28_005383 [Streblomastix strix]|uniref:Uncharacterized protein n=1 Tax=Streblomastix strix TaxID=222440 RepID=A0A5J4WVP5_9EUKA|nr:MAG: hypothetical protein EZS28_005383 [Streblomastix strix]
MKSLDNSMIVNKRIIRELKLWIRIKGNNQPESLISRTITSLSATYAALQVQGATLIYENKIELIQFDCWSEKEVEITCIVKEIKAIYYSILNFEQVFKKMQAQAIIICTDNIIAVNDIGKWKAKESLIERIEQWISMIQRHISITCSTTKWAKSNYTSIHQYTFSEKILEIGQRMKDQNQKLPPGNVGAFLLDLSHIFILFIYEKLRSGQQLSTGIERQAWKRNQMDGNLSKTLSFLLAIV